MIHVTPDLIPIKDRFHTCFASFLLILLTCLLWGCSDPSPTPEFTEISDQELLAAEDSVISSLSITMEEGFSVRLWASELLLEDPIALNMDPFGRAWVTVTNRRSRSEFPVRSQQSWMNESLGLRTVEEKRAFIRRELSKENSDENRRLEDFNEDGFHDWQDLTVLNEEVYRIEDTTGNGAANRSQLFIRDFHEEITDLAGGILYHNGEIFVTVGPDLWKLTDPDDDGIFNHKESVSHGYNIHAGISGHGMSGVVMGPDGRLYWGVGDHGLNVTDKEGKEWYYPNQGAILRSDPDGSNFEVFAAGLRNTHEFAFDKFGNLIAVDHDGDFEGEEERLVYLVDGSDSGWRTHWQFGKYTDPRNNEYNVWMEEGYSRPRFEGQTTLIIPPIAPYHTGPTGMTYNPGTALSEQWRDTFFVTSFPANASRSVIYGFKLEQDGASFRLTEDRPLLSGILATGLDVGPDGALYFADWLQGWGTNNAGRIWKLDIESESESEIREEVRRLLGADFTSLNDTELIQLLSHADMRVRQKAQFELAFRNQAESLLQTARTSTNQLARIHAVWGVAQIARRDSEIATLLQSLLTIRDSEVLAQTVKMIGDLRSENSAPDLIPLLGHESARVRFFAAEALGRIGWEPAMESMRNLLQNNDDKDLYIRHAASLALARIGNIEYLTTLVSDSSLAVRRGALMAFDQLSHPLLSRFLRDTDESIVTDAARAISDDGFIEEALSVLAELLDEPPFMNESLIRRSINANLYLGGESSAKRLVQFATREDVSITQREEALMALSVWATPPILDRVAGRYRGNYSNQMESASRAFQNWGPRLLSEEQPTVVLKAALKAAANLNQKSAIPLILTILDENSGSEIQIAALEALKALSFEGMGDVVNNALSNSNPEVRAAALSMVPDLSLSQSIMTSLLMPMMENGTLAEQKILLEELSVLDRVVAIELLNRELVRLKNGLVVDNILIELYEAIELIDEQQLTSDLEDYLLSFNDSLSIEANRQLTRGGDPVDGRRIFFQHAEAVCARCHTIDGSTGGVGPDLGTVGMRLTNEEIVTAIINPDETIAAGYGTVSVITTNGERVTGLLVEESGNIITLQTLGGDVRRINKSDISEQTNMPSGMPTMKSLLTDREIRDLVTWLSTLSGS